MDTMQPRRSSRGLASPSAPQNSPHNEMREMLDDNVLTTRSIYCEFAVFLDLRYGSRPYFFYFLNRHVSESVFTWTQLLEDESARLQVATEFTDQFGFKYWGNEEQRRIYLIGDRVRKHGQSVCKYPENRLEIIETIFILLEKRAQSPPSWPAAPGKASNINQSSQETDANIPDPATLADGEHAYDSTADTDLLTDIEEL